MVAPFKTNPTSLFRIQDQNFIGILGERCNASLYRFRVVIGTDDCRLGSSCHNAADHRLVSTFKVQNQIDRRNQFLESGSLVLLSWITANYFVVIKYTFFLYKLLSAHPSIRKPLQSSETLDMAFSSKPSTSSLDTRSPFFMIASSSLPLGESEATYFGKFNFWFEVKI